MTTDYRAIVVDVETSRLDDAAAVCEFAAVELSVGVPVYQGRLASALVFPGHSIAPEASAVHHLTDADVADAGTLDDAIPPWVLTAPAIVAHNAEFDKKFLPQLARHPWICTWRCGRHLWPDAPRHSNQTLRYWLGIRPGIPPGLSPHRALYDAICTAGILTKMLEERTVSDLVQLTKEPVLLQTVGFGKHRGQLWKDVPKDYCAWILRQSGERAFDEDTRHTATHWTAKP
jgi:exodeoxyribonuclease X